MKYLAVFVLVLVAVCATVLAEDAVNKVEMEFEVFENALEKIEPAPRAVCQIGGNRLCNIRCKTLGKKGGSCKKGVCYCRK